MRGPRVVLEPPLITTIKRTKHMTVIETDKYDPRRLELAVKATSICSTPILTTQGILPILRGCRIMPKLLSMNIPFVSEVPTSAWAFSYNFISSKSLPHSSPAPNKWLSTTAGLKTDTTNSEGDEFSNRLVWT